jgi:hypothetical protein
VGYCYFAGLPGVDLCEYTVSGLYSTRRFLLSYDEAMALVGLLV